MSRPLVSIVTPSYNQARWLEETIECGSTDASEGIVEALNHGLRRRLRGA